MSPVGGSRHYGGPGLGDGVWRCPACGSDNTGPLAQGCQLCGSGKPGRRAVVEDANVPPPPPDPLRQGDHADYWAELHPEVLSIAEAYRQGYLDGVREAQAKTMRAAPVTADVAALAPEAKPARTIVAALEFFRDQVLSETSEEIASGEWCSVEEVNALITQLKETYGA